MRFDVVAILHGGDHDLTDGPEAERPLSGLDAQRIEVTAPARCEEDLEDDVVREGAFAYRLERIPHADLRVAPGRERQLTDVRA